MQSVISPSITWTFRIGWLCLIELRHFGLICLFYFGTFSISFAPSQYLIYGGGAPNSVTRFGSPRTPIFQVNSGEAVFLKQDILLPFISSGIRFCVPPYCTDWCRCLWAYLSARMLLSVTDQCSHWWCLFKSFESILEGINGKVTQCRRLLKFKHHLQNLSVWSIW